MRLLHPTWISDFRSHLPTYEHSQDQILKWLAKAHARAESNADLEPAFERRLRRFGCAPYKIRARRTWLPDFSEENWDDMKIFTLSRGAEGEGITARMQEFARAMRIAMPELLANQTELESRAQADEIIHVSCTGYEAPSFPQRWLASLPEDVGTRVTHAYHMGCYAAVPAIRLATGSLMAFEPIHPAAGARIDIVHTEYCTLHLDPSNHSPEQLVIQSLFSDGAIRYSLRASPPANGRSFRLLACREERAPGSADEMTWSPGDHGMRMSLSRDVPERISVRLKGFIDRLSDDAGLDFKTERNQAVFAIHPGGPKIIDGVEALLEARPDQVAHSRRILLERGNMSSATLPTLWEALLDDPMAAPAGRKIISLAFGPGLTLCGTIFEVEDSATYP